MNKFRTITVAGAATLALAGGAALTGSAAGADDGRPTLPDGRSVPAKAQAMFGGAACSGGAAKGMRTGSADGFDLSTTAQTIPGSSWTVRGPKKGKDAMLVTLSSWVYSGNNVAYSQLYRNSSPVGDLRYLAYDSNYDSATNQFCVKFGKGLHTFDVRSFASADGPYLYQPVVTYQRFE